jgi:hypothetical protein
MMTPELQMERRALRGQLRRAFHEGNHYALPIDRETMLLAASDKTVGPMGIRTRRRLIVRALGGLGIPPAVIAESWGCTLDEVQQWGAEPLTDATGAAAAIEEEVIRRLPERAEPDRHVTPHGDFAVPGIEYDKPH